MLKVTQSVHITFALLLLGCYNKQQRFLLYKQQEFISHISGDWEVQDHGAGRFIVVTGESLISGLLAGPSFCVLPPWMSIGDSMRSFWKTVSKSINPIHEFYPCGTSTSPSPHFLKLPPLGVRISTNEFPGYIFKP